MATQHPIMRLSFSGRVAVALALSYFSSVAWADIVGERNGAQKIYKKGDVEVVDIVSPNAKAYPIINTSNTMSTRLGLY